MIWWLMGVLAMADPGDRYAGTLLPGSTAPAPVAPGSSVDPFSWEAAPVEVVAGAPGRVVLRLHVPAGTHIYKDGIEVLVADSAGIQVGPADVPPGLKKADPGDGGEIRELFDTDVLIEVPVTGRTPGLYPVTFDVRHQGCKVGLCFPPKSTTLTALVRVRAP